MIGNIAPYVQSYYPEAMAKDTSSLFALSELTICLGNFIGSNLVKQGYKTRNLILGSISIGVAGVYLASSTKSFGWFVFYFCIIYGLGVGMGYSLILYKAWKFFPGKEGVASGIVISGFGIGGFIFSEISLQLLNPNGVNPS